MEIPQSDDFSSDEEFEEIYSSVARDSIMPPKNRHNDLVYNQLLCERNVGLEPGLLNMDMQSILEDQKYLGDGRNSSTNVVCSAYPDLSVLLSRQFWMAGECETGLAPEPAFQGCQNRMRVHPKFLHSNATSHKWVFGAVAELLDNAVDEVRNGATYVKVDHIGNLHRGSPGLLVQDDGGGMDPGSLRRCMSFGFSNKEQYSIGHYGNGFKTGTMRLGADVIVFSRCMNGRSFTQCVGLLSYTFLRRAGFDEVVVPVVDYQFDHLNGSFHQLPSPDVQKSSTILSTLLKWSPFATENELLNQFNDIGCHGTKVIIFNLWHNSDDFLELDFESDPQDILISGPKIFLGKSLEKARRQMHIETSLRYSLRVYSSVLYLHMPANFRIILRGEVVIPYQIANHINYRQCIKYCPKSEDMKAVVITTIGFLKDAPKTSVHGFCVYHKNRLILPFWRVVSDGNLRAKGVVGVLEANFIKPTHNKQDFEKSSLYYKLELRLREMTIEYWNYHFHLVDHPSTPACFHPTSESGYADELIRSRRNDGLDSESLILDQVFLSSTCKLPGTVKQSERSNVSSGNLSHDSLLLTTPNVPQQSMQPVSYNSYPLPGGRPVKRRQTSDSFEKVILKRRVAEGGAAAMLRYRAEMQANDDGCRTACELTVIETNKKLQAECLQYERIESQLLLKVKQLTEELQHAQQYHRNLSTQLQAMDELKLGK